MDRQPIAKATGDFLVIMVAIFGGFKAEFSGIAAKNLPDCPMTGFLDSTLPIVNARKKQKPLLAVVTDQQMFQGCAPFSRMAAA